MSQINEHTNQEFSFVKTISFLDGQILEGRHLNLIQKNFAEGIKRRGVEYKYDTYILVSPYKYYFYEPFVDTKNRHKDSTSTIDQVRFVISSGEWITPMLTLPEPTKEVYLTASSDYNIQRGSLVEVFYRTLDAPDWKKFNADEPLYFTSQIENIQVKLKLSYTGSERPDVADFALFIR